MYPQDLWHSLSLSSPPPLYICNNTASSEIRIQLHSQLYPFFQNDSCNGEFTARPSLLDLPPVNPVHLIHIPPFFSTSLPLSPSSSQLFPSNNFKVFLAIAQREFPPLCWTGVIVVLWWFYHNLYTRLNEKRFLFFFIEDIFITFLSWNLQSALPLAYRCSFNGICPE